MNVPLAQLNSLIESKDRYTDDAEATIMCKHHWLVQ